MTAVSALLAVFLAGASSGAAEILRCHYGWLPEIPRRLSWAVGGSATIVALNILVAQPGIPSAPMAMVSWARLLVGVIAYGLLWLLLLQIWRQFAWLRHYGHQ